jgi:hypothetical protein
MTTLLSKAFEKAASLPDQLQNELAEELIEEIEWEKRWNKSLSESSDAIDTLAEKALRDHRAGKTREMGFDQI